MPTLGFIGAGPVGTTFGVRLSEKGYTVAAVADISPASAERFAKLIPGCKVLTENQAVADAAEMVFITTADDHIATVCSGLKWRKGQIAVHCSGASTVQSLDAAREQGAHVGSIHPCQSFSGIEQAIANLPGSTFGIEAEEPVKAVLTGMARALKGEIVYLSSDDKVLYHAAAAIACNYFTTIVKLATDLWGNFGKTSADGIKAYMPLLRGDPQQHRSGRVPQVPHRPHRPGRRGHHRPPPGRTGEVRTADGSPVSGTRPVHRAYRAGQGDTRRGQGAGVENTFERWEKLTPC